MESDKGDLSKLYQYFTRYRANYVGVGSLNLSGDEGDPITHARIREIIDCKCIIFVSLTIKDRWSFIKKPSMLFSYMLNPSMFGDPTMGNNDRRDAIRKLKDYTVTFFSEVADQRACVNQIHSYNSNFALMGAEEKSDYQEMTPSAYWSTFGITDYPQLSQIALRIYQVPTSSAASERVWKAFSFIHSKRRNRLKNKKVEKLAFIYVNSALLDKEDERDYFFDGLDDSMFSEDDDDSDDVVVLGE